MKIKNPSTQSPVSIIAAKKNGNNLHFIKKNGQTIFAPLFTVSQTLDGVTSNAPSTVAWGDGMVVTLAADSDTQMASVVVTMGGVDVTSTAYDSATNTISIASVTGNVAITAASAIIFADAAVKAICAANWGGTIAGELTKNEAAAVISLDGKFYDNQGITSFHELRYFTGLSNLRYSTTASQFALSTLEEVTLPPNITDLSAAFYNARNVKAIDLSNLTGSSINMTNMAYTTSTKGKFYTITLPRAKVNLSGTFRYTDLTTLNADGSDWSDSSNFTNTFYLNTTLKDITGVITGIEQSLSLANSQNLTRDSLLVILNGLSDMTGGVSKTLTLHATAKARLTSDDLAIATAKNWIVS